MGKIKLLIDTDIDDALGLYLAMRMGLDIVGVTTVFGNTNERARISAMLMKAYGKGYENIPVFAGFGTPLGESEREYAHTCHYVEELCADKYKPSGEGDAAVDFMIDCCKKYGRELVVVAIGPFTNIAKAIKKDAEALSLAGKVVIMGGAYYKQYADWNVCCDVEAADIMFRGLDNLECIGADVTHKLPLTRAQLDALCSCECDGAAGLIAQWTRQWREVNPIRLPALHDPLAVYYAACPEVCRTEEQSVAVVTDGAARGLTLNVDKYGKAYMNAWYEGASLPRHKVACDVDADEFIETFMSYFK